MNDLLLKGYECLTVILPFLITFVILSCVYKHKKIPYTKGEFIMCAVFIMYIFAVFYFTGAGTIFDLQRYGIKLNSGHINLLPFSRDIDIEAYFLNVLLFVPFGFLLPLIWPNTGKLKYTVFSGFSFSLLVEISQLFNNRQTDIDDLILNTFGTLLGYLLFRMFIRITKKTVPAANHFKYEPVVYILSAFLGHFLMFNEFGLAKILYNFWSMTTFYSTFSDYDSPMAHFVLIVQVILGKRIKEYSVHYIIGYKAEDKSAIVLSRKRKRSCYHRFKPS